MIGIPKGVIQSQAMNQEAPEKTWVYITYSSSSDLAHDIYIDLSGGSIAGPEECLWELEYSYPAANQAEGDLAVVKDATNTYIQYEVQLV